MLSYRLKTKELIFMLDCFGQVNSLPQGFGNIYIDVRQHGEIAWRLHRNGMITYINGTAVTDRILSDIFKNIYSSEFIAADSNLDIWIYCSDFIIVTIERDRLCSEDYIMTPLQNAEELKEKLTENGYSEASFDLYRGGSERYNLDEFTKLLKGDPYEK